MSTNQKIGIGCLGCGGIAVAGFLFIGFIGALTSDGTGDRSEPAAAEEEAEPEEEEDDAEEPEDEDEEDEDSVEEVVEELPDPQSYDGSGDTVLEIDDPHDDLRMATFTHSGSSNFAIWTIDDSGDTNELLVNEVGGYEGSVLYNTDGTELRALEITADGSWEVDLEPVQEARVWDGDEVTGTGDDVVQLDWEPDGLETLELSHSGDRNFAIWAWGDYGRDLLVNEVGTYEGEARLDNDLWLFDVTADGDWELTRR